jgi:hypothetical protein
VTIFKRITQIITSPGEGGALAEEPIVDPDAPVAANIMPLLVELVKDRPIPDAKLRANLDQLKQIAANYGLAWTAADICDTLERLPDVRAGVRLKKERGYELAADFFRQSLKHEFEKIGEDSKSIDQIKYTGNLRKFIESKLDAGKYERGIETVYATVETFLLKACEVVNERSVCLHFAALTVKTVHAWSVEKREYLELQYNLRRRRADQFTTPPSDDELRPEEIIRTPLVQYLRSTEAEIGQMARAVERYDQWPSIPFSKTLDSEYAANRDGQVLYLEGLAHLLTTTGPAVIHASILNHLGTLRNAQRTGSGLEAHQTAIKLYEQQAKIERELGLGELAKARYGRALAIAEMTNRPDEIERIRLQLAKFPHSKPKL